MKNFLLTLDLEEWYHLEYFNNVHQKHKYDLFIFRLNNFFNFLDLYNIKITVFVVAELAKKYPKIIKDIYERGHEIACHGFYHKLDYNKSNNHFKDEIKMAKEVLEDCISEKIYGYRSPCFSLNREKLDLLSKLGFKYDSSYIDFDNHKLYNKINLSGFNYIDDIILENNGFKEFEVPTLKILNKLNVPISGGAYFRFFPLIINKYLIDSFFKKNNKFIFYIHPFELDPSPVDIKSIDFLTKLRFNYNRENNLSRVKKLIFYYSNKNISFKRMIDFL